MIVVIILTVIFAIMGITFAFGKGGFLIAGYNTANDEDKAKYDERKLNRCFSIFCFGIALVIGITGYIDTEAFAVHVGLPCIIRLVIFIFCYFQHILQKEEKAVVKSQFIAQSKQRR